MDGKNMPRAVGGTRGKAKPRRPMTISEIMRGGRGGPRRDGPPMSGMKRGMKKGKD